MTYEEAVEAIQKNGPLGACDCRECAEKVLDALGWKRYEQAIELLKRIRRDFDEQIPDWWPESMQLADEFLSEIVRGAEAKS